MAGWTTQSTTHPREHVRAVTEVYYLVMCLQVTWVLWMFRRGVTLHTKASLAPGLVVPTGAWCSVWWGTCKNRFFGRKPFWLVIDWNGSVCSDAEWSRRPGDFLWFSEWLYVIWWRSAQYDGEVHAKKMKGGDASFSFLLFGCLMWYEWLSCVYGWTKFWWPYSFCVLLLLMLKPSSCEADTYLVW